MEENFIDELNERIERDDVIGSNRFEYDRDETEQEDPFRILYFNRSDIHWITSMIRKEVDPALKRITELHRTKDEDLNDLNTILFFVALCQRIQLSEMADELNQFILVNFGSVNDDRKA